MRLTMISAAAVLAAAPALAQNAQTNQNDMAPQYEAPAGAAVAEAVFLNANGDRIGAATLIETPHGVLVTANVAELPRGVHGFHIHETGTCDPSNGFQSAGGHYNPEGHSHGYMSEDGIHAGDMPNQTVDASGKLYVEVFNPHVSFSGQNPLFDDDGSAIVIHASYDDYESQPAGNAGDRIACAVIEQQ